MGANRHDSATTPAATLALACVPPSGMFVSAFVILTVGFTTGHSLVTGLALLLLIIANAGLLRTALASPEPSSAPAHNSPPPVARVVAIAVSLALLLPGVWIPRPLGRLLEEAAHAITPPTTAPQPLVFVGPPRPAPEEPPPVTPTPPVEEQP